MNDTPRLARGYNPKDVQEMIRTRSMRWIARLAMAFGAAALGVSMLLVNPPASAQAAGVTDAVKARIGTAMEPLVKGSRYRLEEIRATPMPGVYEVRLGSDLLIYVDGDGRYMFYQGDLVEIASQRNLTRERVEELQTIDFRTLPLDLAIRQVNGNGKRVVAVFEDPNCGYCKRLRADLVKLDDITIYTFPLAFLAADSDTKARKALCAADKVRAWNDLLLNNRVPGNAGTCDTPMKQVAELAQKLGITGTPVLFFSNGRRLTGYTTPDHFGRMLAEHSKG